MPAINLADLEVLAREHLASHAWDYYRSGANDERTLAANRDAFDDIALHYRVLVDVATRDLACSIAGQPLSLPIIAAPTAFQKLAHADGELATARACAAAGTAMILSTLSTTRVEDVVAASSGPVWFQLYVYRDREATLSLVERCEAAGCRALVLTVDAPLLGRREADVRNGFSLPAHLAIENMLGSEPGNLPAVASGSSLAAYFASLLNPGLTWADLDWLRSVTKLPVLVKGIIRADDARRAVDHGVSGIIVSNHGGRQLDTAPATIAVLPAKVVSRYSGPL